MANTTLQQGDCSILIKSLPSESVDIILTDPPYLYLKNQKLERVFDEKALFAEFSRVLKPNGFIAMFGRGQSFYRWNYYLAELGFVFKEEIIWDKSQTSSPLLNLGRVHETISIHCKSSLGKILKNKVPYVEMKAGDLASIQQDLKRILSALKKTKGLGRLLQYLEDYNLAFTQKSASNYNVSRTENTKDDCKGAVVLNSIEKGITEQSIVHVKRSDYGPNSRFTKHHVTTDERLSGDRGVTSMQSIIQGLNEKSIINSPPAEDTIFKELRNHYDSIHPTQKPVRLLERLLLILAEIDTPTTVLDPFMGSGSTAVAAQNMGFDFIGYEIDGEYFDAAKARLQDKQPKLF